MGLCPLLKSKMGTKKWHTYAVYSALRPLAHFFSYLIVIKSFNIIIDKQTKVGFWAREKNKDFNEREGKISINSTQVFKNFAKKGDAFYE